MTFTDATKIQLCVCVFHIHGWISVIYAVVMWSLLCPLIDCKEDKLPNIACTMYCSETIERNWSHVGCLTSVSFDEFLSVDKLIPTTDILSVVQRNHHMHCICSEHSATSFVHFLMALKYCVNWITPDTSLQPFCIWKELLNIVCLYSDFSVSFTFSGITQLCYSHWYVPCCHVTRLVTAQFCMLR